MTPDIFVQFLHLRVSSSIRSVLMSKLSRFFRNHISCAVLSGTLLFPGCYLIPMLQLSDSIFHSLYILKRNIEGITVRSITKGMKYKEVNLIKGMGPFVSSERAKTDGTVEMQKRYEVFSLINLQGGNTPYMREDWDGYQALRSPCPPAFLSQ